MARERALQPELFDERSIGRSSVQPAQRDDNAVSRLAHQVRSLVADLHIGGRNICDLPFVACCPEHDNALGVSCPRHILGNSLIVDLGNGPQPCVRRQPGSLQHPTGQQITLDHRQVHAGGGSSREQFGRFEPTGLAAT